jgi:ABC-2 type transport system ATP-binding protein
MIYVENLTKFYDETCALNNVSFKVEKGEILGLLGPNGAGKTTTLRILTGFLSKTSGTVKIKDFDIGEEPIEVKKLIGYFPETAPLYSDMLVFDYLAFIADMRGLKKDKKRERIIELSNLCGLTSVMHKSIKELSKGFKQRVGLAHAMMNDPEILILDEPTSGLDPNQIVEIRDLIKEIGKKKTVIISSHILSEVEITCDRIVIINQGNLVADGTTDTLKDSANKGFIIGLSLSGTDFKEAESKLKSLEPVKKVELESSNKDEINIKVHSEKDIRKEIYNTIKKTDWIMLGLNKESESLENIFRDLTKEN